MVEIYCRQTRSSPKETEVLVVLDAPEPLPSVARMLPDADRYFLVSRSDPKYYDRLGSAVLHLLRGKPVSPIGKQMDFRPLREETRDPQLIPVVSSDCRDWVSADWRLVSILASFTNAPERSRGWDFYDTRWLIHKWDAGLSLFDEDVLYLCTPVYPRDLHNQKVDPDIVLRETKRFEEFLGKELETSHFALHVLTRDKLGFGLLRLYYDYDPETWSPWDVFDRLYELHESLPASHEYRPFLLRENYSLLDINRKIVFKPFMLIHQLLSFYGMYVSQDYYQLHREGIHRGVLNHLSLLRLTSCPELQNHREDEAMEYLDHQMVILYSLKPTAPHWVGKDFLRENLDSSLFWKTIHDQWDNLPRRNLFLLEDSSFRYNETQMRVGIEFERLFSKRKIPKDRRARFQQIFPKKKLK